MYTIIVHISNAEPVKVDVDELPKTTDTCIIGKNPRLRSEREVDFVDEGLMWLFSRGIELVLSKSIRLVKKSKIL